MPPLHTERQIWCCKALTYLKNLAPGQIPDLVEVSSLTGDIERYVLQVWSDLALTRGLNAARVKGKMLDRQAVYFKTSNVSHAFTLLFISSFQTLTIVTSLVSAALL